jgi:hypothetical protein
VTPALSWCAAADPPEIAARSGALEHAVGDPALLVHLRAFMEAHCLRFPLSTPAHRAHGSAGGAQGARGVEATEDELLLLDARDAAHAARCLVKASLDEAKSFVAQRTGSADFSGLREWLLPRATARVDAVRQRRLGEAFVARRRPIWQHVWAWLHGAAVPSVSPPIAEREAMLRSLSHPIEAVRLQAAYTVAAFADGRQLLAAHLCQDAPTSVRRTTMYGCIAAGGCHIPPDFPPAQAEAPAGGDGPSPLAPPSSGVSDRTNAHAGTSEDSHLPIIASRRLADGVDYELLMGANSSNAEAAFCMVASLANATDCSAADAAPRAAVLCAALR